MEKVSELRLVLIKPVVIAVASVFATLALFTLMDLLIGERNTETLKKLPPIRIEFTRTMRDTGVAEIIRELPNKDKIKSPPVATNIQPKLLSSSSSVVGIPIEAPSVSITESDLHIGRQDAMKGLINGGGIVPMVRITPLYPRTAAEKRIEGWVLVQFNINVTGAVYDPKVLEARPPGYFEQAALKAIAKWKYKPMIKNGKPVDTIGVAVKIIFSLSDLEG